MDSFILGEDIPTFTVTADSFPDGIGAAHEKLHQMFPGKERRRFFGISRPDQTGKIIYKAAAEVIDTDEVEKSGLEKFTIKRGAYNTYYIIDYPNKPDAIAKSFELLTGQAEVDPEGYCIEWYIGEHDVKCMVRSADEDYPVENHTIAYSGHNDNKEMMNEKKIITIETTVHAPVEKVWRYWSEPNHIMQWCHASDDWHAPHAENDLQTDGEFITTMAAKDDSVSFDFGGKYTEVIQNKYISYIIADGRKVEIVFTGDGDKVHIRESFEMENMNSEELQRDGWQAILDNFKNYTESN
jgi:uncharacterized protein YndB with AHSA1/START domain